MRKEHGFTTLEVVIVIAIIVILMGISVPSLQYFQDRKQNDAEAEMNNVISQSLVAYYGMTGQYPIDHSTFHYGNTYMDISRNDAKTILNRIFNVVGYQQLTQYSYEDFRMNVYPINEYVVKIEIEKR